jgi:hypothetical protein
MTVMDTITLELLRHGPAHNQLLSPLTPYLALCENHGAVTVNLPFEHAQLLHRLGALRYEETDEPAEQRRRFEVDNVARELGGVLARIPGLIAETNKTSRRPGDISHLRLIISANEMALLPFELAFTPEGCPGAGQHMVLQPHAPLCVTREVRRAPTPLPPPGGDFRVLFVAAAPKAAGKIPLKAHNLALRRAIAPWVRHFSDDKQRKERVEEHLVVLPNATIEEIAEQCAVGSFTHVHILAHGVSKTDRLGEQYFIALHDAADPSKIDYVSGKRLAAALRPNRRATPDERKRPTSWYGDRSANRRTDGGIASPLAVTLATCDGGAVGSVIGNGASIAHDLHDAGIPIVAASQFPLTFAGSVRMVEDLYEGLLWGEDPRLLMHALRRRLYADQLKSHDWAGLTLYAALPENFDEVLTDLQVHRARLGMEAAMNWADEHIRSMPFASDEVDWELPISKEKIDNLNRRIDSAMGRLGKIVEKSPRHQAHIYGLLGSSMKRQSELLHKSKWILGDEDISECISILQKARDNYYESYRADRANSWALVQYLSLELFLVLRRGDNSTVIGPRLERIADYLSAAEVMSNEDRLNHNDIRKAWALGNILEINILKGILKPCLERIDSQRHINITIDQNDLLSTLNEMLAIAGRYSFEAYSTLRQLKRYLWFNQLHGQIFRDRSENVYKETCRLILWLAKEFPDDLEEVWS